MKEYEFTGLVAYALVIEAESESEARKIVNDFSPDGWKLNGEPIEVSDIDLITERELTA